jgi:hypothetical protein
MLIPLISSCRVNLGFDRNIADFSLTVNLYSTPLKTTIFHHQIPGQSSSSMPQFLRATRSTETDIPHVHEGRQTLCLPSFFFICVYPRSSAVATFPFSIPLPRFP